MINSSHSSEAPPLRCGCRESSLSLIQSESALAHLRRLMPFINWKILPYSSPGDRDRRLDLRESPGDFFSRDLDEAVRSGKLDSALHSAKDLPQEGSEGIDWFWLPWREDPRDALIMREGDSPAALSRRSRIGVSSDRRHRWCAEHYPAASLLSIRGSIESRLAQLDRGDFDAVIMAAAALKPIEPLPPYHAIHLPERTSHPAGTRVSGPHLRSGESFLSAHEGLASPPRAFRWGRGR